MACRCCSLSAQPQLLFEDFSGGLGSMTPVLQCGVGSTWALANTCPASPGAPSPASHARFGVAPGCATYASGDVSFDLETPAFPTQACRQLTLRFSYLLDFEEGPAFDRATVSAIDPLGLLQVLYDNGFSASPTLACSALAPAGVGGLDNDASWHAVRRDLSSLAPLGPFRVVFTGETADGLNNDGQGFLIDDVALNCSRPGDQVQVNTFTSSRQDSPSVAMDAGGAFVVVWTSNGSYGTDTYFSSIQGQRYAADGAAVGSQFQVNAYTTRSQIFPAIAMDTDGTFVVVWESDGSDGSDSSGSSIQGRRFAADGSPVGLQFQVNAYTTSDQNFPRAAMAADGAFVVVWDSNGSSGSDSSTYSIQGQRFASDGSPSASQFQVNSYTTGYQFVGSAAMDADGDFVVVWQSYGSFGSDGDDTSVQGQRYASDGSAVGSQFQVNTYTTSFQVSLGVAMAADGAFVVVWASLGSPDSDSSSYSIRARRFAAGGSPRGAELQVNTYTTGSQSTASAAMDSDGDFVVVWGSYGSAGSDSDAGSIQAQRFASDGSSRGSELQVNAFTAGAQRLPSAAMSADGGFVVAWESYGSYGTDDDMSSVQGNEFLTIFSDGFESGDTSAW